MMRSFSRAFLASLAVVASLGAFAVACGGGQPAPSAPSASPLPPLDASAAAPGDASASPAVDASFDSGVFTNEAGNAIDAGTSPGQKSWRDMSHDERLALMKTAVLPQMKKSFQHFDAKQFADFSCATCHGAGTKNGKFEMPNPELPQFPKDKGGFSSAARKHPATMQFMVHGVAPEMAAILGLPLWDSQNPSGFGCGNCHVMN
jgi:hypothetical protein